MGWQVEFTSKAHKQFKKLPQKIRETVIALVLEIGVRGPIRGDWPNYSKLSKNKHHCHLKKGRPTYVNCWEVAQNDIKLIEVYYVGTHENAPY